MHSLKRKVNIGIKILIRKRWEEVVSIKKGRMHASEDGN